MTSNSKFYFNIIVAIVCFLLIAVMIFSCSAIAKDEPPVENSEEKENAPDPIIIYKDIELTPIELEYVETDDKDQLERLINEMETRKECAAMMAECARSLGYEETHQIIMLAKSEWANANDLQSQYIEKSEGIEEPIWRQRMEEYPAATTIWLYMKNLGWNDYVCAGIMGNMMTESGGQTLAIQPEVYSPGKSFYGICQWSKIYFPEIQGADLLAQCDFLRDTIEYQMKVFGSVYKKGFNYEAFLELTDERDAALAFAETYERCGEGTYTIRQNNATTAYKYFVKEDFN